MAGMISQACHAYILLRITAISFCSLNLLHGLCPHGNAQPAAGTDRMR